MKTIPYGRQYIDRHDLREIKNVIYDDYITTGKSVEKFENNIKKFTNAKYALTCNSGTSALYLAFKSIDIGPNDNILIPSINFVAASNMLTTLGANIFLVDVNKNTGQITPQDIEYCIKKNNLKNIKAIITMYLGGNPINVINFFKIKKKLKCYLIEDACHALGSTYINNGKNYKIGSCQHSDISTFSMHPLKSITSGEGGIITTNSNKIFKRSSLQRNHGIVRSKKHYHYNIKEAGMNFRLSDINSALAISQLKKIESFIKRRNQIRILYNHLLSKNEFLLKRNYKTEETISACHLYQIQVDFDKLKINRNKLMDELKKKNIITQVHYIPIYEHTLYKKLKKKFLTNTDFFYRSTISLPIFFKLKNSEINYICKTLNSILIKFKKN